MRNAYLTAFQLALAMTTPTIHAQDLAVLDHPSFPSASTPHVECAAHSGPTDIHDDGESAESVPSARQLMVVTGGRWDLAFTLDILDEQGRVVKHHLLDPTLGQRYWTIDVAKLRAGRYAARVLCAEGAVVNRFRRD